MAGTREIKGRIKSIKNIRKITKAMELVAASKMKRSVSSTLASRPYAAYSREILTSVAKNIEETSNPLFHEREVKNVLLILITSNRGLCGAYNAQVVKKTLGLLREENMQKIKMDILAVGKKGDASMRRVGQNVIASFLELPDNVRLSDVNPISKLALDEFSLAHYDKIYVAYTDFISALSQKPNVRQVLPISKAVLGELLDNAPASESKIDYLFEGDFNTLIAGLAEKITKMQIYQMFLESAASEQSSRMVAMKNASESSNEMIDDLTLIFNKARQANITKEISEISAGMATVS